ncbi:hypothetical protein A2U01_0067402, partial [Trifolium medium]|nr:hypothetical protein [Trifolium medium]
VSEMVSEFGEEGGAYGSDVSTRRVDGEGGVGRRPVFFVLAMLKDVRE